LQQQEFYREAASAGCMPFFSFFTQYLYSVSTNARGALAPATADQVVTPLFPGYIPLF
jgi:hypothetical protein